MITSIEIAKILRDQRKKAARQTGGFDAAISNLGVGVLTDKKQRKKNNN